MANNQEQNENQKAKEASVPKQLDCSLQFDPLEKPIKPVLHELKLEKEVPTAEYTVGQDFTLTCKGESINIVPVNFKIQMPKKSPQNIKDFLIVKPKLMRNAATEIEIQATSLVAGNFNLNFEVHGDLSGTIWQVQGVPLNVHSVRAYMPKEGFVDPNKKEQLPTELAENPGLGAALQQTQAKPFPSMSQFKLDYPWYLWAGIAFIVLAFVLMGVSFFSIRKKKKDFIQRWEELKSPIGSHKDFHKTIRSFERKWYSNEMPTDEFLSELYQQIRLFFFREYKLSDEKQGHKHLIQFFSKNKKTSRSRLNRLAILLDGIEQARKQSDLKQEDVKDYTKRARELIDHLYLKGAL